MQLSINCRIGLRLEPQPPPLATKPNFVSQTCSSVAMVRTACRRYCMPPMTDSINRDACTINLLIFQYRCNTIMTFCPIAQISRCNGATHMSRGRAARRDWLQQLRLMNNANEAKFLQISCASLVALVYEKSEIFIE